MIIRDKNNNLVEINRADYYSDSEYYRVFLNQKEINFVPKEYNMREKFGLLIKKFSK